jgi:hypothetical protein
MVNLSKIIPSAPEMGREIIIVLVGVLGAAYILSRFPALQAFVTANSVTVKNTSGTVLF